MEPTTGPMLSQLNPAVCFIFMYFFFFLMGSGTKWLGLNKHVHERALVAYFIKIYEKFVQKFVNTFCNWYPTLWLPKVLPWHLKIPFFMPKQVNIYFMCFLFWVVWNRKMLYHHCFSVLLSSMSLSVSRNSGGTGIKWNTLTSGLCWWC